MKGGAAAAAVAAAPAIHNWAFAEQIQKLEKEGWTKHPVACTMCGAYCGILAMRKEGEPISEKNGQNFPQPRTSPAWLLRTFCSSYVGLEPSIAFKKAFKTHW